MWFIQYLRWDISKRQQHLSVLQHGGASYKGVAAVSTWAALSGTCLPWEVPAHQQSTQLHQVLPALLWALVGTLWDQGVLPVPTSCQRSVHRSLGPVDSLPGGCCWEFFLSMRHPTVAGRNWHWDLLLLCAGPTAGTLPPWPPWPVWELLQRNAVSLLQQFRVSASSPHSHHSAAVGVLYFVMSKIHVFPWVCRCLPYPRGRSHVEGLPTLVGAPAGEEAVSWEYWGASCSLFRNGLVFSYDTSQKRCNFWSLAPLLCDKVLSPLLDRECSGKSGGPITAKIRMGLMGKYI